jgi:hypothetical protein
VFCGLRQILAALNFWGFVKEPIFNGDLLEQQDRIYASMFFFAVANMTTWLQTLFWAPLVLYIPY